MRTITVAVTLTLLLTMAACSSHRPQIKTPQIPSPEKRLYTLKHKLNLTAPQMEAIRPILEDEYKEKSAIMESFKDRDRESMQANREKLENLEWDVIKKLSDHLDEEQMNLYVDLLEKEQEAMKAQMQERRGGKGAGGGRGKGSRL